MKMIAGFTRGARGARTATGARWAGRRGRAGLPLFLKRGWICLAILTGAAAVPAPAADEAKDAQTQKAAPAEAAQPDAAAKPEEKKETAPKALTPEQYFEGGEKTYNNWVEIGAGGLLTTGSKAQAEQSRHHARGAFGGIEDLHYQAEVATNVTLTVDGRALFDQDDYKLTLGLTRPEKWYLRVNYQEFRTWYNANGGFFPPGDLWYPYPFSDDALALDRGEVSFEGGLTLKKGPTLAFKYTHQFREGDKSSTSWGQTHPGLIYPARGLVPSFYDIDERRDIFELNAKQHVKATDFALGLRYETADLDNARKIWQWPGEGAAAGERKITDRQGTSYDLFNVNASSETWIKKNLFFSAGFLFVNLDSDFSGSRIYGSDFDVGYAPNAINGAGYTNLFGGGHKHEYVLNLNLMSTPLKNLTLTPSIRVQREDWNADSTTYQTLGSTTPGFLANNTDGDALDVRERLDARYTGVTNCVLYAQGEWTEGQGRLDESGGSYLGGPIQRRTDDTRFFQKYTAGVRVYPARSVTVDVGGYYKNNRYDYDHDLDSTPNNSANRYPAYLVMQGFETYDGYARLTLRPVRNVTLMSRYEYQRSTIHTRPDPVSGLGEVESSRMTSHILAQNVSWAPWSRLYLQAGFNYVLSQTETPASDYTQAVLEAENNYWTLNFNSGLVLDYKTDLNVGYTYYRADDYTDNSLAGVPYGAGAEEHGVTATVVRRLSERLRLTLRYGFYHYEAELSGGHNNYEAHVLFSSLQYRF
jgi:hypothetical protein